VKSNRVTGGRESNKKYQTIFSKNKETKPQLFDIFLQKRRKNTRTIKKRQNQEEKNVYGAKNVSPHTGLENPRIKHNNFRPIMNNNIIIIVDLGIIINYGLQ